MHGKICYVEIPAANAKAASEFYTNAFGWTIRTRGDGSVAFDDATAYVSGSFVEGRAPARDTTLIVYVMVDDIHQTLGKITASGGRVTKDVASAGGTSLYANFTDPTGNTLGVYQESKK